MTNNFEQLEIMIRCGWNIKRLHESETILSYPNSKTEFFIYDNESYFRHGEIVERFVQRTDNLESELKMVQDVYRTILRRREFVDALKLEPKV